MTWLQEMAAENRRLAALACVTTPPVTGVPSQADSVPSQAGAVTKATGYASSRKARWRIANLAHHRATHAAYMRKLRARLASARNAPVTASDSATTATTSDA